MERAKVSEKKSNVVKEHRIYQPRVSNYQYNIESSADRILFLQKTVGNQTVQRLVKSGLLRAKLIIGEPNDVYEREADRIAGQVMQTPVPLQKRCAECEEEGLRWQPTKEEDEEKLRAKGIQSQNSQQNLELKTYVETLKGVGQPLPESVRAFYESRFGYDFSQVRVHTNSRAEDSAKMLNARAFTLGRNIVFGTSEYMPGTTKGKILLAHELAHVVQQGSTKRKLDNKQAMTETVTSTPVEMILCQRREAYYVIGDAGLNAGNGIFLNRLTQLRPSLMGLHWPHRWTLVISIHGSPDFIAERTRALRGGPGSYDAAAIRRIFSDNSAFVRWRNEYGPSRVVLNACQVSRALEGAIIKAISRPRSGQPAQGLGTGCRPDTVTQTITYEGRDIKTREQFNRIPRSDQLPLIRRLQGLNRQWGYFGAPPVPNEQVLHYYFDEPPYGGWPVVRVTYRRRTTSREIPFYNRGQNPEFMRLCEGFGELRPHVPRGPPPVEE